MRVLRDTPPEAQVDYGLLGRWLDPATERMRRVWGFVIVLTCSRLMFLRPVLRMDESSWVEAHVLALEFFGGSPRRVVPDNLKTGVVRPDLYDPKINRSFGELAAHYGCLVDPARLAKPRDKATVERHVPTPGTPSSPAGPVSSPTWRPCRTTPCAGVVRDQRPPVPADAAGRPAGRVRRRGTRSPAAASPPELRGWPGGRHRRSAPTSTSRWARPCTRCRGPTSGAPSTPAKGCARSRCSWSAPSSRPHVRVQRAARPTTATTRRRGSPSSCTLPAGVGARPLNGRFRRRGGGRDEEVNALYRLRQAQDVVDLATASAPSALRRRADGPPTSAIPSYKTVKGVLTAGTEHEGYRRFGAFRPQRNPPHFLPRPHHGKPDKGSCDCPFSMSRAGCLRRSGP